MAKSTKYSKKETVKSVPKVSQKSIRRKSRSKNAFDGKASKMNKKDYLKKIKKTDPNFFREIMDNKDVLEASSSSEDESEEENDLALKVLNNNKQQMPNMEDDDELEEESEGEEDENKLGYNEEENELEDEEENEHEDEEENELEDVEENEHEDEEENELEDEEENDLEDEDDDYFELEAEEEEENVTGSEEEVDEEENESETNDDEEEEISFKNSGKITKTMIKMWKDSLRGASPKITAFKNVEQALTAALKSIEGGEEKLQSRYSVEGPQMFNMVVKMCLNNANPALCRAFALKSPSSSPVKSSKWKKLFPTTKRYLRNIIMLTKSITDSSGLEILVRKGIMPIIPLYIEIRDYSWTLTKQLISLWCTSYEKVRVLALLCLFRLIRSFDEDMREKAMKELYMSYVKNCHFTSPTTWPLIDFMRMSLVEFYSLDHALAYRHAFLYIKQLALHLRNAMILQKKERIQLVYNWQFIHCIHLWADLLSKTHPSTILQPLFYPLIQVAIGTIGLINSAKYYPLVFHISKMLADLSKATNVFIPVMSPLLSMLSNNHLRVKPKKASLKPLQFDSIFKVSVAQLNESAFSDGVIEQVYDCLLYYLNNESSTIGFPELVFPAVVKLKSFINKCKVPDYKKKMKQLLDKINENSKFIEQRRKQVTFAISDLEAIKNWEIETLQSNPPLHSYYLKWKKVKDTNTKDEKRFTANQETDDDIDTKDITNKKKKKAGLMAKEIKKQNEKTNSRKRQSSDSKKEPESKKTKRMKEKDGDKNGDIVREMKLSDFEDSDDTYNNENSYDNEMSNQDDSDENSDDNEISEEDDRD